MKVTYIGEKFGKVQLPYYIDYIMDFSDWAILNMIIILYSRKITVLAQIEPFIIIALVDPQRGQGVPSPLSSLPGKLKVVIESGTDQFRLDPLGPIASQGNLYIPL